jgi:recombination associated protein RdgC
MYFKNATALQITSDLGLRSEGGVEALSELLSRNAFKPCSGVQSGSFGWVPPLHDLDGSDFVLSNGHQILIMMKMEEKVLPPAVLKKLVNEKVKERERAEGRKVGSKERASISHDLKLSMLPDCLSKETYQAAYISIDLDLLVVDTVSNSRTDLISHFFQTMCRFPVAAYHANRHPREYMTEFMRDGGSQFFKLGDYAFLVDRATGAKIKFEEENLASDEVQAHIAAGSMASEIGAVFVDDESGESISCVINAELKLKKIHWPKSMKMRASEGCDDLRAQYDADFCLMAGELDRLFLKLFNDFEVARDFDDEGEPLSFFVDHVDSGSGHPEVVIASYEDVDERAEKIYQSAVDLVKSERICSISRLQRYLKIGYNTAADLVERMEKDDIVGSMGRDGKREIL